MGYGRFFLLLPSFIIIMLTASSNLASFVKEMPSTPTMDIQTTGDAAVLSTAQAQEQLQEVIESGVIATLTALPPIPSPTPISSSEMSEELLASAVNSFVDEADAASKQCSAAVSDVTSDGTVAEEDVIYISPYVDYAEDEIEQALALADDTLPSLGSWWRKVLS